MESNVTRGDFSVVRSDNAQPQGESQSSGVSWGAVIGGAFVAAAVYLILLALGAGFGLSAISPWSNTSATTVDTVAIIWLILIEAIAAAMGGYLTGRLRTKWTLIHNDEVFFRDTANGFLAWAVALVMSVTLLGSAATAMAGRAAPLRLPTAAIAATPAPNALTQPIPDYVAETRLQDEAARKATAHFLLWLFVSLLFGAFCASYAATIGGRQRDHVKAV